MSRLLFFLGITFLVVWVIVGSVVVRELLDGNYVNEQLLSGEKGLNIAFNQDYVEKVSSVTLDLEDPDVVFEYVFSRLPSIVYVYPTENYYYWRFYANNQEVWGNIRLDAVDRDKGLVSFGYFGSHNRPEKREDLDYIGFAKQFGPDDGLYITKQESLQYLLSYQEKNVTFMLNDVPQSLPEGFQLRQSERFMARTFDESGFQFVLLFDADNPQFSFVLDESAVLPDVLYELEEDLFLGRLSGFAFYRDALGQKVLIGVDSDNIRRNNYFDGPFDQLADNFVKDNSLQEAMEEAYPYVRGRIDEWGVFHSASGERLNSRLALTPYATYDSYEELRGFFDICKGRGSEAEVVACLTRDYKQNVPGPEQ